MQAKIKLKTIPPIPEDPLLHANLLSETIGGGTNAIAALSNGRLSVSISPWGELTHLRWPSLSCCDHLRYFTAYKVFSLMDLAGLLREEVARPSEVRWGEEAPCEEWKIYGRPLEPYPELGSRAGVLTPGANRPFWLNDPVWSSRRNYASEDSAILITTLSGPANLEIMDWIDPEWDLLVRVHRVEGANRFFYHSTFAPFLKPVKGLFASRDPKGAGFGAVYYQDEGIVIHFQPRQKRWASGDWSPKKLDSFYPEGGVFLAWGFDSLPSSFQIGADRAGRRVPPDAPPGGRLDAEDGMLQGNPAFRGPVDAALSLDLPDLRGTVVVFIALGSTATEAVSLIRQARELGTEALIQRVEKVWKETGRRVFLPLEEKDKTILRVAKRSVLSLLMGQDASSGAIVASLSRQPAYYFDFPRDSAFFDLGLDVAGFPERVDRHLDFLMKVQMRGKWAFGWMWLVNLRWPFYRPEGHFKANYSADGSPGSMPHPFEIDSTGLAIWNLWRHEAFVPDERKEGYQKKAWEVIKRGAEALMDYVDLRNGWVRPAFEDDSSRPSATFHGASSTLTALMAAADAARRWVREEEKALVWEKAASALRRSMLRKLEGKVTREILGWRGLHWSLWPAPLFRPGDHRCYLLMEMLAKEITEKVEGKRPGFSYLAEQLFALALAPGRTPEHEALIRRGLEFLAYRVATPGTDHFGEIALRKGEFYQNRTAIPHLWNGILFYLAFLALHNPEIFHRQRPPYPPED
ncbi:MAG: hypothetical protein RMK30_01020 [Anaerolineae bacterium]|nr:hypothetical protein [Anaerolineae bacterium]MDW8101445.1 hypothetical protein [Anaerolineae bacterium]